MPHQAFDADEAETISEESIGFVYQSYYNLVSELEWVGDALEQVPWAKGTVN